MVPSQKMTMKVRKRSDSFSAFFDLGFSSLFSTKLYSAPLLNVLVIGVHQGDLHEPLLENIPQDLVKRPPKLFMVTESFL